MSGRKESVASLGSLGSSEDSYSDAESEGAARSSWGEQESSCQEIYDICGYIGPSICSDSPDTSLSCLEVGTSQRYTHNMVTIFSDNVCLSSSGCSEHEANNPQSGQQGPGAPCNYLDIYSVPQLCLHLHCAGEQDDPGDRAEEGGVQPSDEEQEQEEDLQVPEDPGDARAGGAAGQVEIIQGGVVRV